MDGCAQTVIHHLVSRGLNHLGCSHISILASVFFRQCDRHQIQCLWAQSWMAAQLGPHIYMPGIKYDAFGRSHGWLRNMGCHEACLVEFIPVYIARPRVHSSERQDRSAASPFQHSVHVFKSSLYAGGGLFQPSSQDFYHGAVMWCLQGRRGGQGGCGISILLGSAWNLPLVWKSAFGHAKGAGGATLAAHNGLTGSRCEHLTRTRRRVASASSKDAPGV